MATDRLTADRIAALEARVEALEADEPDQDVQADEPGPADEPVPSVDELASRAFTRDELDEIATGLGVDSPESLPTKRVVAEHIVEARSE